MAYGASLESWLGESPRGFESPILRHVMFQDIVDTRTPGNGVSRVFASTKLPTSLGAKVVSRLIP